MGAQRTVETLIAPAAPSPARARRDEPTVPVGTGLLHPHLVLLDFATGTIEIESQA